MISLQMGWHFITARIFNPTVCWKNRSSVASIWTKFFLRSANTNHAKENLHVTPYNWMFRKITPFSLSPLPYGSMDNISRRNTQKHRGYQRLGMTHFDTICTFNPLFSSTTCVFNVLEIMWWSASRNADRKSANTRQQKLQLAIQRSIVAKLLHFSTEWLWMRVNSQILNWGHLSYNFF